MKAIRVYHAGGPEVLRIKEIPRPLPRPGWVLIRVKAFGLNRSELFTRQGFSPSVQFPRVLGIECVGIVEDAADTDFVTGQTVAALIEPSASEDVLNQFRQLRGTLIYTGFTEEQKVQLKAAASKRNR